MTTLVWVALVLVSFFSTGQTEDMAVMLCAYKVFSTELKSFSKKKMHLSYRKKVYIAFSFFILVQKIVKNFRQSHLAVAWQTNITKSSYIVVFA